MPAVEGKVLIVAPQAPPYGGMAAQAQLLLKLLRKDNTPAAFLASNGSWPAVLKPIAGVPGLRTILRAVLFCTRFWKTLDEIAVVQVFAASWVYFFLIVTPAVVLGRARGKRVVINYRGGEAERFLRRCGPIPKAILRVADCVTAPSPFLADRIGRMTGVEVLIVPNIVDLSAFRYRERTALRPRMLVTRHLEKIYDQESVLRAFRIVRAHYADALLSIAGTGSEEAVLKRLVSSWGLENVRFLGYVPREHLPALYNQHDILLNASRADNFPGSLVEAAACGLAVISTDAGGIPHIFENGKNAVLVKPGDWAGLAQGVLTVLEDDAVAARLRRAALECCHRYEWARVKPHFYRALRGREPAEKEIPCIAG